MFFSEHSSKQQLMVKFCWCSLFSTCRNSPTSCSVQTNVPVFTIFSCFVCHAVTACCATRICTATYTIMTDQLPSFLCTCTTHISSYKLPSPRKCSLFSTHETLGQNTKLLSNCKVVLYFLSGMKTTADSCKHLFSCCFATINIEKHTNASREDCCVNRALVRS